MSRSTSALIATLVAVLVAAVLLAEEKEEPSLGAAPRATTEQPAGARWRIVAGSGVRINGANTDAVQGWIAVQGRRIASVFVEADVSQIAEGSPRAVLTLRAPAALDAAEQRVRWVLVRGGREVVDGTLTASLSGERLRLNGRAGDLELSLVAVP